MPDLATFGKHVVKHLETGKVVPLESLWAERNCVVIFFRRWGCVMCRLYAKQLSEVVPILKNNDIDIVGVGCEELGSKEFLEGKFFDGELYVDAEKKVYQAMEFKRFNFFTIIASLLWSDSRAAISEARKLHISGNLAGDGLQTGGALIVGKGGVLLHEFKQNGPADHMPNSKILEVLGLEKEIPNLNKAEASESKPECTDECKR